MKRFGIIKVFLCAFSLIASSECALHFTDKITNDDCTQIKTNGQGTPENENIMLEGPRSLPMSAPSTRSNTIYQTEYYAPYYFKNLTNNYGKNVFGSCGYIATGMLLSFWDTYWDDSAVEERYEQHSQLDVNHTTLYAEAPGGKRELTTLSDVDSDIYHSNISNYSNDYLHFLLLKMGNDLFGNTAGNYSMYYGRYYTLISNYLYTYRGFSEYQVEIVETNQNVRQKAIEYIKEGIPVKLGIDGHAVVAYDYDETSDKIYCHFGWGSDATHVTIEEMGYRSNYNNLCAIRFLNNHNHSNNYEYQRNGQTIYHCPCELFVPYDIQEQNFYVDVLPTFKWDCLCNEKWFRNKDAYLRFEILNSNMQVAYYSSRLYSKSFTLNASAAAVLMSPNNEAPSNSYYVRVTMRSNMDSSLNGMYYYFRTVYKPIAFRNANNKYLSITGLSKSGSRWTVTIKNRTICKLDVEYNSKMCNFNDAKNWTGLSDKKHVSISPLGTASVTISENWFATSITMSHVYQGSRYITYANNLNSNGTFSSYTNVK